MSDELKNCSAWLEHLGYGKLDLPESMASFEDVMRYRLEVLMSEMADTLGIKFAESDELTKDEETRLKLKATVFHALRQMLVIHQEANPTDHESLILSFEAVSRLAKLQAKCSVMKD